MQVETNLDNFLKNYFCGERTDRGQLFYDKILVGTEYGLNFSAKQRLFSKICEVNDLQIDELKKILKFITATRNKVAHSQRFYCGDKTVLQNRKSTYDSKEEIELTDELMGKIRTSTESVLEGIWDINTKLNAIKKPPINLKE